MPTLLEEKTRQFKKRSIIITCCLVALFVGVVPAYAGIGDILMSIFGWLISTICQFVLGILETIAAVFLTAMSIDYDELQQMHVLSAFANFAPVIQILSTTIAGVILLWQLLTVFFGPYLGTKQNTSTGSIVARALIFIPLTFVVQPLAEGALRMFQDVYASLLNDWYAQSGTTTIPSLSEAFTNAFGGFGNFFSQVGAPIPGILANELAEIASILVSCVLLILIMWNYLKFLLEMTQRFVVMIVYVYLSPLAVACGVSPSGIEIAKKSLSVFISSGVLWLLNVWCIGIASGLFGSLDYATGNATNFLVWALVTYGFLKIIQQLDDIFNAVGATNVKLSGDPLSDLLGMGAAFHTLGGVIKSGRAGLENFGENGFFSGKGSSPNSPVTPNATSGIKKPPIGDALVKGATQAAAGVKGAIKGEVSPTVAAQMLKSGTKTAAGGVAGAVTGAVTGNNIVRGIRKTGENIRTRVGGAVSEAHTMQDNMMKASMNGALSRSTAQERAEAMKALAADQPQVLNSDAVKAHMGEAMGLAENQKVTGLSVDKDGNLSATVATQTANGVTLSKVSGLNDMDTNAPAQNGPAQPTSATYSASQISDPTRSVATATYTGVDGKTHQAEVTRTSGESLDGKTAMFTVTSDDGKDSAFNAPANMTAEEVGAVFTGSASPETMAKYQAGTDASDPKQSMSGAHTTLGVNTDISGSSVAGTPIENSPDSKFSVGGITMARTDVGGMNQGKDVWTGYDSQGNSVGTVEVPQGTSARQVADMVVNGGQDKGGLREFTEAAGISGYTSSDVSFSAQPARVADANSPDTSFSVGGVTMARTDAGSNGSDVWTGYNAKGESIGTVEVPQGASAQQVADMVVSGGGNNDSVREFTQAAGVTGFSRSDVSFEAATPAPADANSPDTSFSVGGVTMARTDAGSNGSDVWTGYNAQGESIGTVEVPQGASAQQVADMVVSGGGDNDSVREFTQTTGVTGFSRSDVSFEAASPAPADASSPDTNFSVGGVTMARTDAGVNGSDVWTGYNAQGESVGTIEVPQGASAQQVADMVVHSHDNDSSGAREFAQSTGISAMDNPDVTFAPNPEVKSVSFAGEHDNGTNWSPEFKMGFSGTGEDASPDFRYSYQNENGETVVARAVVSRLDDLEMPPENGKVGYMYTNNHGNTGRIYLDANITPEQLAAALATENGGGIEGIEEIRKELGIRESYTADEGKQFRKALELARRTKKGPLNSADNPVGKGEKN